MTNQDKCQCTKIEGHLDEVKWRIDPRITHKLPEILQIDEWTQDPHIWLYYVQSADGLLPDDDVLRFFNYTLFTKAHRKLSYNELKMEARQVQMNRLIISDQLIKLDRLDKFKRMTFLRILGNILSFQDNLELVSLENLCSKRVEGVHLIQQLACFNSHSLKYLFLWRFVLPDENPLLINYSYITDEDKSKLAKLLHNLEVCEDKLPEKCSPLVKEFSEKFGTDIDEEVLEELVYENPYVVDKVQLAEIDAKLRALVVESRRAKKEITGSLALTGPDPKRPWRTNSSKELLLRIDNDLKRHSEKADQAIAPMGDSELRDLIIECQDEALTGPLLICREDQIPGLTDAALGVGGYCIPDTAWRRVTIACPDLYVFMAFFRIRDYDNLRRFISPSIPLRETHLQYGIDLKYSQRQDSDLTSFVRHIAWRYADTLVTLSIHQWRGVVFPIRRIVELIPSLVRLHYIGLVEEMDLRRTLNIVACGVTYRLKQMNIQVQDSEQRRDYWTDVVHSLNHDYKDIVSLFEIDLCISIYKS
ncbi:unnamed protein product [Leptidea sinapis]|uniref:Uncharacterized protein n=1 Tax=Leptidea sinapis TaxID=189913 RepID=A0A5E4R448_9NEOP|nr:unnamed protein product [Leptidea sinapis]